MNKSSQILQLLQNINAQLGELNIVLKENNLPVIRPADKRQIATYKERNELYDYIETLPKDKDIFPIGSIYKDRPKGTSISLLGRTMREMGWEKTTVRRTVTPVPTDGRVAKTYVARVWRYGHVITPRK